MTNNNASTTSMHLSLSVFRKLSLRIASVRHILTQVQQSSHFLSPLGRKGIFPGTI